MLPPSERSEPILRVTNLSVGYPGPAGLVPAVRSVTFEIHEGETLSLVGETGSGKSSIALALLGLHPAHQQSGSIVYRGRPVGRLSEKEWRSIRSREIGIVFQDTRSALNPVLTVAGHIVETLRAHRTLAKRDARQRALELLREVGIPEAQAQSYPYELSGGACQRAGIALAVCNEPRLLIADEPTSAIDTAIQAQILELLHSMKEQRGLSLLLVSHDLPVIAQVSDRIAVMYHGRIVECGRREEILAAPAHPYTQALLECQPTLRHHHETKPLRAIPGAVPAAGEEFPGCAFAPRCSYAGPACGESVPAPRPFSATHWSACIRNA